MEAVGGERKTIYYFLCMLAGAVTLFPVSGDYILSGGMVTEWIARVKELASGLQEGHLCMFPSAEAIASSGVGFNGLNSNLWFFLPGLLYGLSGNLVAAYRIYMVAVQMGTLLASMLFFRRVFAKEESLLPMMTGVMLYMTCPYRIYICYDFLNLSQAAAWMLLPLYLWAVLGVVDDACDRMRVRDTVAAALTLAGIGYADGVFFVILVGTTLLIGLMRRNPWSFVVIGEGVVFFGLGLSRLFRYLFLDGYAQLGIPLKSIMSGGYRVGEFFSSYYFRDGHPGMGIGMLVCILAGAWLWFVEDEKEKHALYRMFTALAVFFMVLSLRYFPWDLVERLGIWALKLVSLMNTPAFFVGMTFLCLCVPAADSVNRISRHKNRLMAYAIPVIVVLFCLGICVYQCNTLMYNRPPSNFGM